jgi:hypothetical protein
MFVKRKVHLRHVQIWLWICLSNEKLNLDIYKCVELWPWVCLSKEKLTLYMSKYDFEYVSQRKSWLKTCSNITLSMFIWLYTCPNITLSMFVKGKVDLRHIQIWLWICLSKKSFTLDMSKYDFEYVC